MSDTRGETFIFRFKAVAVTATAAEPEGRTCTEVFVKEPKLNIVITLETGINIQLTPG